MTTQYDSIIVGSGAGGGTLAQQLAEAGKRILILERGEHLPREIENWDPTSVFIKRRYRTDEKWRDAQGKTFTPNTHYWVGGNTTFYGAVLMRMRESDFEETRHAGGISPAWPIRYEDLAPYYDRAEKLWRVRGEAGADPAEPPRSPEYPYPPITHDPEIAHLVEHLERDMGWQPFTLPLGVQRDDDNPVLSPCIRCRTCGGFPCLVKAKSDARTLTIEPILNRDNVTLLTGRHVERLELSADGQTISRVICSGPGGEETHQADRVILAAGAANTAAILLRSANSSHPTGLANRSDQVGRNYMFHTMTAVISASLFPIETRFPKTLGINDYYHRDPDGEFEFPMGHIQSLEYMEGPMLEGQLENELPGVHFAIPKFLASDLAKRMLSFLILSEDLPDPDNRITWKDGQIHLAYTYNNLEGHERLVAKFHAAMRSFSEHTHSISNHHFEIGELLPIYGTAHQNGTARMGDDPKTSVVDRFGKAHDLENLYICDTSIFCSSAAVNPTLTLVALALRQADHLLAN